MLEALLYVSHVAMCAHLYLIIMNDEFYRHCKGTACDKMLIIRFQPFYRTIPSRLGVKQGHISTVITNGHDHIYIYIRPIMSRPGECTHLFISCNNHCCGYPDWDLLLSFVLMPCRLKTNRIFMLAARVSHLSPSFVNYFANFAR